MRSILVDHGIIVTMDKDRRIIKDGAVYIQGNKIVAVGKSDAVRRRYGKAEKVIDAKRKAVLPGLINAHDHAYQTLVRTLPCDIPFPVWDMKYMFRINEYATEEDYYYAGMLTFAEMLRTGTTCVVDNHFYHRSWRNIDYVAKAMKETGIRGILAFGFMDKGVPDNLQVDKEEAFKEFERIYANWNGKADGRIKVWAGPPGFGMCTDEAFKGLVKLSKRYNTKIQVHMSGTYTSATAPLWEVGKKEIEHLRDIGLLGPDTLAVHCVWLTDDDLRIIKETDTKVVHTPVSNAYLAFGVAPIPKMLRRSITVALGTDGLGSNTHDMFEVMRMAAYLHKIHSLDPRALTAEKILEMATINGAKAIGLEKVLGSLEEGKIADLIVIDLTRLHVTPHKKIIPALVYCGKGSDVETVIVNGRIVVENGVLKTINEAELINKAQKSIEHFWERGSFLK